MPQAVACSRWPDLELQDFYASQPCECAVSFPRPTACFACSAPSAGFGAIALYHLGRCFAEVIRRRMKAVQARMKGREEGTAPHTRRQASTAFVDQVKDLERQPERRAVEGANSLEEDSSRSGIMQSSSRRLSPVLIHKQRPQRVSKHRLVQGCSPIKLRATSQLKHLCRVIGRLVPCLLVGLVAD
jgi:hypothetical protein